MVDGRPGVAPQTAKRAWIARGIPNAEACRIVASTAGSSCRPGGSRRVAVSARVGPGVTGQLPIIVATHAGGRTVLGSFSAGRRERVS